MTTAPNTIGDGVVVSIHYTLTLDDGSQVDSSRGGEPLQYLHGAGNIVPGLEAELAGRGVGESFEARIVPDEAYGQRHEGAEREVPREQFPADAELTPGQQLFAETPDGQQIPLWVKTVAEESVLVDFNHPLAGEHLTFSVEVMALRAATEDEQGHGHAHGPGGHDH